jgi:hypothetical protein
MGNLITIDRTKSFNPARFIGMGWTGTIEEQDERSLALTEVDISQIHLETCLKPGEEYIKGEEKIQRLKSTGHIRLDGKVFQTFLENKHLIPEWWKEKTNESSTFIFFDGTIFRDYQRGLLCVFFLCWFNGRWHWDYDCLERNWRSHDRSALLKPSAV